MAVSWFPRQYVGDVAIAVSQWCPKMNLLHGVFKGQLDSEVGAIKVQVEFI